MEEISEEFLNKLRSNDSSLKEIQFCRKIYDSSINIRSICIALKGNNTVKKLYLGSNDINDDGANDLSNALTGNSIITMIYLADNKISAPGATKLATVLVNNKAIKTFNIASNKIGDLGAKEFAEVLRKNKRVTSLDLSSNHISGRGIEVIANALVENTTLTSLSLADNTTDEVGINALTQRLKTNYTLTKLIMAGDGYLDESIDKWIRRNEYLMRRRRDQFIYSIVILAADNINPNSESFWSRLPTDLKLYICKYLVYKGVDYFGKSHKQVYTCAIFIFSNSRALRLGLKRGYSFKVYERHGEHSHSPPKFSFTFFYKAKQGIDEIHLTHSKDEHIENFKVITLVTYAQVLLKKDLIISLVKQFGYSKEVNIHYDVPFEGEEKFELRFIVKEIHGKEVSHDNGAFLEAKLSAELGCEAHITAYKYIPNLYRHDADRKSALITDEMAIKRVIYRINNSIATAKSISDSKANTINFEDIECKYIKGDYDELLQKLLLQQAEAYLEKKTAEQNKNVNSEAYNTHGLLPDKKRKNYNTNEGDPSQKKPELKNKGRGDSCVVELIIPVPGNANSGEEVLINPTSIEESATVGSFTPSPTKRS